MLYTDDLKKATSALIQGNAHLSKKEYAKAITSYKLAKTAFADVVNYQEARDAGKLHKHITDNMSALYLNLVVALDTECKFDEAIQILRDAVTDTVVIDKPDELKGHIYHNHGASLLKKAKDALDAAKQKDAFAAAQKILDEAEIKDATTKMQACIIMWQARNADPSLDTIASLDKMRAAIEAIPNTELAGLSGAVKYVSSHVAVAYLKDHKTAIVKGMIDPKYCLTIEELRSHVLALTDERSKVSALIDLAKDCEDATESGLALGSIALGHNHPDLYDKALLGDVKVDDVLA